MKSRNHNVIKVSNLHKSFNGTDILKGVSFEVNSSDICVFLGPNGAGKTTTIKILLSFLLPSKGKVSIWNQSVAINFNKIKHRIGVVFSDKPLLLKELSVERNLETFSKLYNYSKTTKVIKKEIDYLIEQFDLKHYRSYPISKLSSGVLTRVSLCKALVNNPDLLILDEPTANTDIINAGKIRNIIKELNQIKKTTIFFTTHNMAEAVELSSDVLFINNGYIEQKGKTLDVINNIGGNKKQLIVKFNKKKIPEQKIKELLTSYNYDMENNLIMEIEEESLNEILERIMNAFIISEINIKKKSLEDLFK